MSIMTKIAAEEIVESLTSRQKLELHEAEENLKEALTEMYTRQLPKALVELSRTHTGYFRTRSDLQIEGNGFSYNWVKLLHPMPYSSHVFSPNEKDAAVLLVLYSQKNEKYKILDSLITEIKTTLLNLKS